MDSESRHLLVLSEHQAPAWARRLWALGERPTVCVGLGEALRALAQRRHQVFLIELPVAGHTHASILAFLVEHPLSPGLRFIVVSATPQRLVHRDDEDPRVSVLMAPCSDTQLQLALAMNSASVDSLSPASEPLWDSGLGDGSQTIERWDQAAIAAQWAPADATSLRANATALATLCTSLCRLPVEPGPAVQALHSLAPRVRALVRRVRLRPPRTGARQPGALLVERVAQGWVDLLAHVLQGLDRTASGGPETTAARSWVVLQAMRIHRVTVILELLWGVPRYPGMWRRLHELQTYTNARIRPQLGAGSDRQLAGALGAIAQTYREALILGCALVHPPPQLLTSALVESLSDWASGTRLLPALRQDWQRGWWVGCSISDLFHKLSSYSFSV
ncbi:hypothetical protein [Candidatus Thiodictyon syntrophicum]|jgi:hypothetical protein|uniref:Uncharacterized protein n=1 Tax=Candidatus Thiodictyon syntrophicum TaxID=1166950 RepID=A0A2K8UHX0_9GAMM|nr:hypothetical protein [Candidatus Thiodictyon syntrophicum]AUB85186.1 hypothetical protein THSYN_30170 [Candidatus Thiodictyon syntrophicum]